MNKAIHRIAGLILALVMMLGNTIHAQAVGNDYYVSPTGNDANPGTASAPFKTFAKANSVLRAGSTLYIYSGVYNQSLKITQSGTSTDWINIQPLGGRVAIDLLYNSAPGMEVQASYVSVSDLVVRNVRGVCVNLKGTNITVSRLVVNSCAGHGIHSNTSSDIKILNSRVFRTVQSNASRSLTGGWGSGIKVRLSNRVLIQGNTVYNNYGEGIGTRGTNIMIRANTVYDNYSVNIYTNSENAWIERNFVYCTSNSGYERSGLPATGIALAEEYFEGWGARSRNARVLNNIVAFCKNGIRYTGADARVTGGGLKNAIIAYNTIYGTVNAALSITYASGQANSLIANNIIWQAENRLSAVDNTTGLTFKNNLWKVLPPAGLRGPGDRTGDPGFVGTPGYTAQSYRPSDSSPAAGGATNINILNDLYGRARGPEFDMGAIQFSTSVTSSTMESSDPSPTVEEPASTSLPVTPTLETSTASSPTLPPTATSTSIPVEQTPIIEAAPELLFDNKDSAFVYSEGWVEEVKPAAIDGSFARTSAAGASVTFPFTGQSFSLIYKGGPSYRNMEVYLDDVLVATIDQRHDASTYKARWDYPGPLTPGQHTLKLVFVATGSKTNGSLDAVIVR